jgi:hypothetical protein
MKSRPDYMGAKIMCGLFDRIERSVAAQCDISELESLFYGPTTSMEEHISIGFASRNFPYLMKVLDMYPGDIDSLFYTMLNTLVELDKLKARSYMDSKIKQYLNAWTKPDIYNMYCFVFKALEDLRSISSDTYEQIVYLFGLLQYQRIPQLDAMDWEGM